MTARRTLSATLLLALLSGCGMLDGLHGNPAPQPPADVPLSDLAFCQHQAQDAPRVKELRMIGLGNVNFAASNQVQLHQAEQDAVTACLRGRGVLPQGGVERLRPS
jgi:hypothetical protein